MNTKFCYFKYLIKGLILSYLLFVFLCGKNTTFAAFTATTATETTISTFSTQLNGSVNPNNTATVSFFLWDTVNGSCQNFRYSTASQAISAGGSPVTLVDATANPPIISGLVPGNIYYYCAVGVNSTGIQYGNVVSFTQPQGSACLGVPATSNYTVSSSCLFPNPAVDGVDKGTGTTNDGILTLSPGQTLTLAAGQTIAFGFPYKPGANIVRGAGSTFRVGAIWIPDSDGDGYPDFPGTQNQIVSSTQPIGYVRRAVFGASQLPDCAPYDPTKYRIVQAYTDLDGDGYTTSNFSVPTCIGATYTSTSLGVDCDDSNTNIYQNVASLVVDTDIDGYKTAAAANTYCVGGQLTNTNSTGRTYYRGSTDAPYYLVSGQALGGGATDCDDTTGKPCPLTNVSASNPSSYSQNDLSWSWSAAIGPQPTGYDVQFCTGSTGCTPNSALLTDKTSIFNHTSLSASTIYRYGVYSKNASGSGLISNLSNATTTAACANGYQDFDKDGYGTGAFSCYAASGSYNVVGNNNDCNDGDPAIILGSTRTRWSTLGVSCGTACGSEPQTCNAGGVWSGTYALTSTCAASASTRTMYQASTSACGTYSYTSEAQTCLTGGWSPNTKTLSSPPANTTRTGQLSSSVGCGTACANQAQTCQSGGGWDGSGTASCTASTRTAYSTASVACGSSCSSQFQTCLVGGWNGAYAFASCSPIAQITCYRDADNDTYSINTTTSACSCAAGWKSTLSSPADCNDSYATIKPGAGYSTATRPDTGTYDWDCSGGITANQTFAQYCTSTGSPTVLPFNEAGCSTIYYGAGACCGNYNALCTAQAAWSLPAACGKRGNIGTKYADSGTFTYCAYYSPVSSDGATGCK